MPSLGFRAAGSSSISAWWLLTERLAARPNGAELLCRGWDAAMNRQPEAITWNVMGMMNNSYFRIHVHRTLDEAGLPALRFQHPTLEIGRAHV